MTKKIYGHVDDGQQPLVPPFSKGDCKCDCTSNSCSPNEGLKQKVDAILEDASPNLDSFKKVEDKFEEIDRKIKDLESPTTEKGDYVTRCELDNALHGVTQGIPIYIKELLDGTELIDAINAIFVQIGALEDKVKELESKVE